MIVHWVIIEEEIIVAKNLPDLKNNDSSDLNRSHEATHGEKALRLERSMYAR